MIARLIALPAILVALFAVAPSPVRSELPEAPAPRAKKTTAETLVGKWKVVELGDKQVAPELQIILEFTGNGEYRVHSQDPKNGVQVSNGSYKLINDTIRLITDVNADPNGTSRDVVIEAISDDQLTTVLVSSRDQERTKFSRLKK
jgi:uncharacterized protein (TIGR03066 family)